MENVLSLNRILSVAMQYSESANLFPMHKSVTHKTQMKT